jgi:hypothetical protein
MALNQVLKNTTEVLNATVTVTASGSAISMQDNSEGFIATIVATTVGGTTPTFDFKLQHSDDGSNWYDLETFTQITTDTTELKEISKNIMKNLRYDVVVGGTTPTADIVLNLNFNNKRSND